MKRCPTCKGEFEDSLTYCLDDGSPLVSESRPDESTLVTPSTGQSGGGRDLPPTQYGQLPGKATVSASQTELPAMPTYRTTPAKRRVWPWVIAALAILFLFALVIAAVIAIPKMVGNRNSNRPAPAESPSADRTDARTPDESASESGVPTDEAAVLSQLTELEREWTVANVEGDTGALERILADEYRGGNPPHTKQQYLAELRPDPSVKSWEFQDLRLDLNGDRATLDGYLRQETTRGTEVYSFTDDFVWRDGRWQATGSRTTRVK